MPDPEDIPSGTNLVFLRVYLFRHPIEYKNAVTNSVICVIVDVTPTLKVDIRTTGKGGRNL